MVDASPDAPTQQIAIVDNGRQWKEFLDENESIVLLNQTAKSNFKEAVKSQPSRCPGVGQDAKVEVKV